MEDSVDIQSLLSECATRYNARFNYDQIDARDVDGLSALHHAVNNADLAMIDALLTAGADVNAVSSNINQPTRPMAFFIFDVEAAPKILERLLQAGLDINDNRGSGERTPLHVISDHRLIEAFLAAGASPNVQDWKGDTPLHECLSNGDIDCAVVLIAGGASLDIQNDEGISARQLLEQIPQKDEVYRGISKLERDQLGKTLPEHPENDPEQGDDEPPALTL